MPLNTTVAVHEKPRVLVLLASFNGAPWIGEQLESIGNQTDVRPTILVCDDGSSDDTVKLVHRYVASGLSLQLIDSPLPGGSAGQNFFRLMVHDHAKGYDYVAFADQDDYWEPNKLSRAIACLTLEDADGYSSAVRAVWPDGKSRTLRQSAHQRRADYLFEGAGQGCSFVCRRASFEAARALLIDHLGQLGALHYHDWTLYALFRVLGQKWVFDDQALIHYRQHGGNDTGARSSLAGVRKRIDLIRNGWYGRQVAAIAKLCTIVGPRPDTCAEEYLKTLELARLGRAGARARLACFTALYGRRKLSDRIVLSTAAALGYL